MKISFLVTYYNQQDYVARSLDSILAIDMPCEYEILISDDGSTDGTVKIVNEYIAKNSSNIKLFVMSRNDDETDPIRRVSAARMYLLKQSTGDYVVYLDGDDYYCDKTFIKDALDLFLRNEKVSVISFDYKDCFDNGTEIAHRMDHEGILSASEYIEKYFIHVGACVHKKFNDTVKWKTIEENVYFDDNDIMMNTLSYGEMYHVPRIIYSYSQHANSSWHMVSEIEKHFLNVLNFDIETLYIPTQKKELFDRYLISTLILHFSQEIIRSPRNEKTYSKCMRRCQQYPDGLAQWLLTGEIGHTEYKTQMRSSSFHHLRILMYAYRQYRKIKGEFND